MNDLKTKTNLDKRPTTPSSPISPSLEDLHGLNVKTWTNYEKLVEGSKWKVLNKKLEMLKESEHFSDTFKESVKPNEIIEIIDISIDDDDEDGIIQVRCNNQSSIEMMSHKGFLDYFT